jgi:hypothetical protein
MFFGREIVGCLVDVQYPEDAGRFVCEVFDYNDDLGWHKIRSVNVSEKPGFAYNFESNSIEEDFTDEIDLNSFFRERRVQFVGKDDSPYIFCPLCKWQSGPLVSCINCSGCGHVVHTRCATRASNQEAPEDIDECLKAIGEEYICPSCCRSSSHSPVPGVETRSTSPFLPTSLNVPLEASQYDDMSNWSEDAMIELNAELWDLQPDGRRKYKFISGIDFLNNLCCGSVNHALTALQHCSTAGVLSWVYEDGSESENCRILRRGLDQNDESVNLIVCVSDISPTNQPRLSSKPPSQAWCCHMTFGFVAISGLLKVSKTKDHSRKLFGQILVFACRSTQVRSIDELHGVITERAWSNWTVLDNADGQLIDTLDQVSTHVSLEYTVNPIPPPCRTTEEETGLGVTPRGSGRRGISLATPDMMQPSSKNTRQVLYEILVPEGIRTRQSPPPQDDTPECPRKIICRENWDPNRFTLLHRGFNHETTPIPPSLPPCSRLVFGACIRMFQKLNYRVVLLELALPITDFIQHHGQGREVEVVTSCGIRSLMSPGKPPQRDTLRRSDWPDFMPHTNDMVLARTSNAAAYKLYRAFGLGEHSSWNGLGCNASSNYKYPVLGCVIGVGGVSEAEVLKVAMRQGPSLRGINSWLPRLKKECTKFSKEPAVVQKLITNPKDLPIDTEEWMSSLHLFEEVLDLSRPDRLGVVVPAAPPSKKMRKK